ncbi:MAG TPA: SRPBCC domain-containing protein [Candidatus Limnocylindrales bacterium]
MTPATMTEATAAHATVTHGTFTIQRTYPVSVHELFGVWSSQAAKDEWFASMQDFLAAKDSYTLDFRVGGAEILDGRLPSGRHFHYAATHQDIVPDVRIIQSYDVLIDDRRISVSVITVEFLAADGGATLLITEQGTFLDGFDNNDERRLGALSNLDSIELYFASRGHAAPA